MQQATSAGTQGRTSSEPPPSRRVVAAVPVAAVIGALLLLVVGVAISLVGALTTGVSWDEPWRVGSLNNFFEAGWFVDQVDGGLPVGNSVYVYAPIPDLFTHALGVLSGAQEWGHAAVTAQAYAARHVGVVLISLIAVASAAAIAGILLSSWRWAVVTAALLVSVPVWTGHAMFNGSDMPVAAGYTLATLGAVLLIRAAAMGRSAAPLVTGAGALALGLLLAIGTRPATWPALLLTCLIPVVAAPLTVSSGSRARRAGLTAASVACALVAAGLVLVLVYPAAFSKPLDVLRGSVSQSSSFGVDPGTPASVGDGPSLLTSLGYLPSWLVLQLPVVIGVLIIAGIIAGSIAAIRIVWNPSLRQQSLWAVFAGGAVVAQLIVLPLGAALLRSNVYDGIRQFLFIVPTLAVIAALGLGAVVRLISGPSTGRRVGLAAVWVLVGLGCLVPMLDQLRLFPYGYAYVNEVAAREPVNGRIPTDYWRTSMRELIPRVPAEGPTSCTFDPLILGLVPIDCATQGQLSPYWDTRGSQSLGVSVPAGKYLYLETNRGRVDPGPGCSIIDKVTRTLHGEELVMSYVAVCEAPCVVQEAAQCAGKSLAGANLDGWNLRGSDFAGADFTGTSLVLADLSGSNLAGANLSGAIMDSANLSGADLSGADFTGANLTNITLDGAITTGAIGLPDTAGNG